MTTDDGNTNPGQNAADEQNNNSKEKVQNDGDNNPKHKSDVETDFFYLPGLNLNSYASKKSLAQAILDLALLSANASQLKFILHAGTDHEFYYLILTLVITSITLQIVQAIICIILGLIFNINKVDEQKSADIINNICLCVVVFITVINVILAGFDIKGTDSYIANYTRSVSSIDVPPSKD